MVLAAVAAVGLLSALAAIARRRDGVAFAAGAGGIAPATGALFTALYPNVLPSTVNAAYTLTTGNASSTAKTLAVMTVVAYLPAVRARLPGLVVLGVPEASGRAPQLPAAGTRPAAADGSRPVKPFDPRLLRHARSARLPVAAVAGLGAPAAGLIILQAPLLARASPRR